MGGGGVGWRSKKKREFYSTFIKPIRLINIKKKKKQIPNHRLKP